MLTSLRAGSWGSTLGIDYAERYADVCLGLIVRGIYLNTKAEFDAIYTRAPFEAGPAASVSLPTARLLEQGFWDLRSIVYLLVPLK